MRIGISSIGTITRIGTSSAGKPKTPSKWDAKIQASGAKISSNLKWSTPARAKSWWAAIK